MYYTVQLIMYTMYALQLIMYIMYAFLMYIM